MGETQFLFAGFGGQGVLFSGKVTAYAGMLAGKEVTWLPSYGPEMRGGTANCSVCVSEEPIGSPQVNRPDVLIAFNVPSYEKYIDHVLPGGKVFVDSSLIPRTDQRSDITFFPVPATQISTDEKLDGIANMILLGKMLKEVAFCDFSVLEQALRKCVPQSKEHLVAHNLRALRLGMDSTP